MSGYTLPRARRRHDWMLDIPILPFPLDLPVPWGIHVKSPIVATDIRIN
jgi:hypothetical protein